MKKTIIIIIILLIIVLGIYYFASKNKGGSNNQNITQNLPSEVNVSISNFSFSPAVLTIKKGAKMIWTNNDTVAHTVTSDSDGLLNSPTLNPGDSFSYTFMNAGTTAYHCNIHKTMKGTIVVIE